MIYKYALYLFFTSIVSMTCFASTDTSELTNQIHAIETKSNATIGVTAIYLEKNTKVTHHGDMPFFMASTVKLPIAITFLTLVDEKKDQLNRVVTLDANNSVPGTGVLHHIFEKKRMNISLKQILKYMLVISDNSASDTILKASRGPQAVTKRMSELGCNHILINRSILETLLDTNAIDHALLKQPRPVFSWVRAFNHVPLDKKLQAWKRFQNDRRDTTTPDDMAKLLESLYRGKALSSSSTHFLMQIMEKCRTGRNRIKGMLPANVRVAHKTGTWAISEQNYLRYPGSKRLYRFASDVGIITLPRNKGHVAIAVYVKSRGANDHMRSRAIALASKAVYDHFMKQPTKTTELVTASAAKQPRGHYH
jgi:beta-lactamase class A